MAVTCPTIRLFVSSTFSDFKVERDALHDRVFPELRSLCEQYGARFQAIDLRWGVNASAALDQRTMDICLNEIARCQRLSPKPNFIVLLGDRYGWQPVPEAIPADEYAAIRKQVAGAGGDADLALLDHWYRRDDNAVPAEYVLQARTADYASSYVAWESEERRLRGIVRGAVDGLNLPDSVRAKYELSATGQEILRGALDPALTDVDQHVFGFFRQLEGLPIGVAATAAKDYMDLDQGSPDADARTRLDDLKARIKERLQDNITDYRACWTGSGITTDHLDEFCADVYARLEQVVKAQLAEVEEVTPLVREITDHDVFAKDRVAGFTGRDKPLGELSDHLTRVADQLPIIIHAPSGAGKSAFMAEAARRAQQTQATTVIMQRFIGVTPASSNPMTLLRSILAQIAEAYGDSAADVPTERKTLLEAVPGYFSMATSDRPLMIFIDALDQLGNSGGLQLADWLPRELPEHASLIVSTTEESSFDEVRSALPDGSYLYLPEMAPDEGEALLRTWLTDSGRTLNATQQQSVLDGFARNGLPLYLRLAFEQAQHWHAYDGVKPLSADVRGLVSQLLGRLKLEHAPRLVDRVFDYLAVSRHGLTEDELLDMLSLDEDVMREFNDGAFHEYPVYALPVVVWSRLHADLDPYLIERDADGARVLAFFHRQFTEVARVECLEPWEIPVLSSRLARYFSAQPNYLDAEHTRPNVRKLMELPYNLCRAEHWHDLEQSLTDFDFCMAKCQLNESDDLVEDFQQAFQLIPDPTEEFHIWEAFMRERAHILRRGDERWSAHKILLQLAVEHADDSPVTISAERWLEEGNCDWTWLGNPQRTAHASPDPCLGVFEGHTDTVEGAMVLPDGRTLSWSGDATLRLWSSDGKPLTELKGHTERVHGVRLLPDGRILSWSSDNTLRLWSRDGQPLSELKGHTEIVQGAMVLADGRILSWSSDNTLRLWNSDGKHLAEFKGHTNDVNGVRLFADSRILSWSRDNTLRLWSGDGQSLAELEGHTGGVDGARLLADGRILSWSTDNTLRLWDGEGKPLSELKGHTEIVQGAMVLADGRILSWSYDNSPRLWSSDGQPLSELKGHTDMIDSVMLLPDSRILSWSWDNTLRLWNSDGQSLAELKGHTDNINGVVPLSDDRILSWSLDNTLRMWSSDGKPLAELKGHAAKVQGATVLSDSRILSWSLGNTLRIWDGDGKFSVELSGHTGGVGGVRLLAGGRILSWSSDNTLRLWNSDGKPLAEFRGHAAKVQGATVLPDNRILSWSLGNTLHLWDGDGKPLAELKGHAAKVQGATVLPDGRILSWSRDNSPRLWSSDGKPLAELKGHTDMVNGVMLLPDGRILSWSRDNNPRLWNSDGKHLSELKGHTDSVYGAMLLPDGRILSWSWDNTLRLWEGKGKPLAELEGHTDMINGVMLLPDGRILSWSWDNTLRLWSSDGQPLAELEGHTDNVNGVVPLSDGRILSWSLDNTLRMWSSDGQPLAELKGHTDGVTGVRLLDDGRILSWSWDNTLRLWGSDSKPLAEFKGHTEVVDRARLLADGRIVCMFRDKTISLWDIESGKAIEVCSMSDAPSLHPDWLAALYPEKLAPNGQHLLWNGGYYCGLSAVGRDDYAATQWHAASKIKTHHLLDDGTAVVSLDSGHVHCLKTIECTGE